VPTRSLGPMTTSNHTQNNGPTLDTALDGALDPALDTALDTATARLVFADPVTYLETLVAATSFPAAA
jgi:hypothetical protein